jgi:predicted O-methyltransferase YrrM
VLEAHHKLLTKHYSFFFRFFWYVLQAASTQLGLMSGNGDAEELGWERNWFLRRLGAARIGGFLNALRRRVPLAQFLRLIPAALDAGATVQEMGAYLFESLDAEKKLRAAWAKDQGDRHKRGMLELSSGRLLYIWTRALKPETVLETGVANGASSYFILSAMRANGRGHLTSIDLPVTADSQTFLPAGRNPGWLVPDFLRDRWTLLLGDTRQLLPAAVKGLAPLDIFIHDSDHSYETMRFEYETAWPAIKDGGWLISDDVDFNTAFQEWSLRHGGRSFVWAGRLGLLKK